MRRRDPLDRKSLAGSVAVHVGVFLLTIWSSVTARPPLEFTAIQIELVSPPPAVQAAESAPAQEELIVETPEAAPPEPERTPPVSAPTPPRAQPEPSRTPPPRQNPPASAQPTPPRPEPRRQEPTPEPAEERRPAASDQPVPEERPRESGEGINVRLEGVRRDYPEYYNNIIRQIERCFRWSGGGSWETTVYFVIRRDGTVADIDFVKQSGNSSFDFTAMGAVECAGAGRLGGLPEDLPYDRLPIQFSFRPQGGLRGGADDVAAMNETERESR